MAQDDFVERRRVHVVGAEGTYGTRASTRYRLHCNAGSDIAAGLTREMLDPGRESPIRADNSRRVKGLQRGAFGALSFNVCGIPSAARLGAAGTVTGLSHRVIYKHGFGLEYAALGCTVGTGSTTARLIVDSTTGRRAGEMILVEITAGVWQPAKVKEVIDGTTLDLVHELSSAPANGRGVRGMYTFGLAEVRSEGLTIEQAQTGASGREYRVLGGFGSLALAFPEAFGQLIAATLTGVGQQSWSGPETLSPSMDSTDPADDDMGVPFVHNPTLYLEEAITRASDTPYRFERMGFELMSAPDVVPGGGSTNAIAGFIDTAGREGGVIGRVTMQIRCDPAEAQTFAAQTIRSGLHYQEASDGSFVAFEYPRMELVEQPQPVTLGSGRRGMSLVYNLLRDTSCTPAGTTQAELDLARTPFRFALG